MGTTVNRLALLLVLAGCAGVHASPPLVAQRVSSISASPAGIFLDHGFMVNAMSDAAIGKVTTWLQQRGFIYQMQNVGTLRSDGTMDPAGYTQLAHWIAVSRKTEPQQLIIAYVSGSLTLVNTKSAWPNIARTAQTFVQKYHVDGVNLDLEPYRPQAPNYIGLFKAVRAAISSKAMLSLDYTADVRYVWSASDYATISSYFEQIMPMLYDTTCKTASCYANFIDKALSFESAHLGGHAQLYPLIPAYASSSYHDPSVENICAAMNDIRKLGVRYDSAGVWWYYGWNATAERDWKTCGPLTQLRGPADS